MNHTPLRQAGASRAPRWIAASLLALSVLGVGTVQAQPAPPPGAGSAAMGGHGHGRMHHGGPGMEGHGAAEGPGMLFMGPPEHVARAVDRMLDGLSATDAQRAQVKQIAQAAAEDLRRQHEAGRALHERSLAIFGAPTVDAAAAESLRQQMLTQHDQASRRVMQAMLDVAKVLTPEQRARIADRMKQREDIRRDRMQRMQREGQRP